MESGGRGLLLWKEKNDAAAVLGGCRLGRDREDGGMEEEEEAAVVGRAGRAALAQSAVSDVGFTAPNPSGALHRPQYSKVTTIDWPVSSPLPRTARS